MIVAAAWAEAVLPVLVGVAAGRRAPWWAVAAVAWAVAAADLVGGWLPWWDVVVVATGLSAGAAGARWGRRWALVGLGVVVGAIAAEAAARVLLAPAPAMAAHARPVLWLSEEGPVAAAHSLRESLDACALLFADDAAVDARVGPGPVTLHVGDSMVVGPGVTIPFVERLAAEGTRAVRVAAMGVSVDVTARWALRHALPGRVDHVVLYVFGGNDGREFGQGLPCCPQGVDAPADAGGCTRPVPFRGPRRTLLLSPPPAIVWALAPWSRLAAVGGARLASAGAGLARPARAEGAEAQIVARLAALRDTLTARDQGLTIVFLPLAPGDPGLEATARADSDALRAALAGSGLGWIDATPFVAAQASAPGGLVQTDGMHWREAGHAAFARWLAPRLLGSTAEMAGDPLVGGMRVTPDTSSE